MKRKPLYNAAQWRWIADRYLERYSARQLAEFLGVHHNTVLTHLRELGVDRREVPLEERKQEFLALGEEED